MNIRVAAAVLKQALSLMQSMPTKTEIPEMPNLDEYKVSVAKYFSPMEAPAKRAPKMTLIQKVQVPEKEKAAPSNHEHIAPTGVGCVQCSRDHISTVTAVLNEAMRFAREGGIDHPEVQRRIELAIDELNVLERIDAAPDALLKLPPKEKAIMDEFLPKARRIRQRLGEVKSVAELEKIAADSHAVRMELRVKKSGLSEQMISRVKSLAQEVNEGKITKEEAVSRLRDMQEEEKSPELSVLHAQGKTVPVERPPNWVNRKPYPHELRFTLTPKQYEYLVSRAAIIYTGHPLPLEHLKLHIIRWAELDLWVQISDITATRIAEEAVSRLRDMQNE